MANTRYQIVYSHGVFLPRGVNRHATRELLSNFPKWPIAVTHLTSFIYCEVRDNSCDGWNKMFLSKASKISDVYWPNNRDSLPSLCTGFSYHLHKSLVPFYSDIVQIAFYCCMISFYKLNLSPLLNNNHASIKSKFSHSNGLRKLSDSIKCPVQSVWVCRIFQ